MGIHSDVHVLTMAGSEVPVGDLFSNLSDLRFQHISRWMETWEGKPFIVSTSKCLNGINPDGGGGSVVVGNTFSKCRLPFGINLICVDFGLREIAGSRVLFMISFGTWTWGMEFASTIDTDDAIMEDTLVLREIGGSMSINHD